jgi:hypothetical protein
MKSFKTYCEAMLSDEPGSGVGKVGIGYDKPFFKKKGKAFDVSSEVFRRFQTGRNKFERWSKFLNLEDSNQKAIYDYAIRNRDATVILRDSETGAMRAIRPRSSNRL